MGTDACLLSNQQFHVIYMYLLVCQTLTCLFLQQPSLTAPLDHPQKLWIMKMNIMRSKLSFNPGNPQTVGEYST